MSEKIALVLLTDFAAQLPSLAERMPVWIVDSPGNQEAVANLRNAGMTITTFSTKENELPAVACMRIVSSLDDHHNEDAQTPAYNELDVIGVSLGALSLEPFLNLGFDQFEASKSGFVAKKSNSR